MITAKEIIEGIIKDYANSKSYNKTMKKWLPIVKKYKYPIKYIIERIVTRLEVKQMSINKILRVVLDVWEIDLVTFNQRFTTHKRENTNTLHPRYAFIILASKLTRESIIDIMKKAKRERSVYYNVIALFPGLMVEDEFVIKYIECLRRLNLLIE